MMCLNCGCKSNRFLCEACSTSETLDKIFNEIRRYNPETCENPYLAECAAGLSEKYAERDIIPLILDYFNFEITEYYYCQYYRMRRDSRFEEAAVNFLRTHELADIRSQRVMYDLIDSLIPNDFIKPQMWCAIIAESSDCYCELYAAAAKYYAMIGEYDTADYVTDKALSMCSNTENPRLLFYSMENMTIRLNKQKEDTLRYRTKKPYWPATEERRRAVAMFYDEKGIRHPRIETMPAKIPENEFVPLSECFDDELTSYCAFWCSEVFSPSAAKCIYQIGAVKVRDGNIEDVFESFVRPWDARSSARKQAAKEAGVPLEVIESAEDVDIVMPKFFAFVGDDVLVSTGALGNQAKLISRAARYAGIKEIKNEFYDLLDLAADTSSEFDFANNTREYLLSHFSIDEGKSSLEKAQINRQLYDALMSYGD